MIGQLLRMFVCVIRGHRVGRWFLKHSLDAGRYNGFNTDRVHLRVGRCERCGDLVCEKHAGATDAGTEGQPVEEIRLSADTAGSITVTKATACGPSEMNPQRTPNQEHPLGTRRMGADGREQVYAKWELRCWPSGRRGIPDENKANPAISKLLNKRFWEEPLARKG